MLLNEDTLSDEEIEELECSEELFSTPKHGKRTRGSRRKSDYKKACRKQTIARNHNIRWYDNLHQYSKNKVHCSCCLCRGKDYKGRHIETRQEHKSKNKWKEDMYEYVNGL